MDTFTALAEPTRRKILERLAANRNMSALDIYRGFKSSPPAISQQLKALREEKLVRVEKRAQQRIYYMNPEPMKGLAKSAEQFATQQEDQVKRLKAVVRV